CCLNLFFEAGFVPGYDPSLIDHYYYIPMPKLQMKMSDHGLGSKLWDESDHGLGSKLWDESDLLHDKTHKKWPEYFSKSESSEDEHGLHTCLDPIGHNYSVPNYILQKIVPVPMKMILHNQYQSY